MHLHAVRVCDIQYVYVTFSMCMGHYVSLHYCLSLHMCVAVSGLLLLYCVATLQFDSNAICMGVC